MKGVKKFVDEIYSRTNIPFQLILDNEKKYTTPIFNESLGSLEKNFNLNNTKCCIRVNAAFSATLNLLHLYLENELKEIFINKQNVILPLLEGKEVPTDIINAVFQNELTNYYIVNIFVENNIEGVLSFILEGYSDSNIELLFYNGHILMIGELEDPIEHIESIRETIEDNVIGKCYISFSSITKINDIYVMYKENLSKINLAIKYKVNESIFDSKKLILEEIVDSVSDIVKAKILERFTDGFSQLDGEMIKTIEVFFRCDLNLSDASKELFIHRNTLIYRLEKIQKCIGYDIKQFNNAVLFKILFFIWKEKNIRP